MGAERPASGGEASFQRHLALLPKADCGKCLGKLPPLGRWMDTLSQRRRTGAARSVGPNIVLCPDILSELGILPTSYAATLCCLAQSCKASPTRANERWRSCRDRLTPCPCRIMDKVQQCAARHWLLQILSTPAVSSFFCPLVPKPISFRGQLGPWFIRGKGGQGPRCRLLLLLQSAPEADELLRYAWPAVHPRRNCRSPRGRLLRRAAPGAMSKPWLPPSSGQPLLCSRCDGRRWTCNTSQPHGAPRGPDDTLARRTPTLRDCFSQPRARCPGQRTARARQISKPNRQ